MRISFLIIFLNKEILEFWKCWKSKFMSKVLKDVQINGISDNQVIADRLN